MLTDINFIFIATMVMVGLVCLLIIFAYIYQKSVFKKERELIRVKSLLETEELKSVYAELHGQEQERLRIAQDIHDDLGGLLFGLKVYLDMMEKRKDFGAEMIDKVKSITDQAFSAVRRVSHDLGNVELERIGIEQSLIQLCKEYSETQGVHVECGISMRSPLIGQLGSDIYYIVRELVNNALCHGEANDIRVDLSSMEPNEVSLIVEDNGHGLSESMGLKVWV